MSFDSNIELHKSSFNLLNFDKFREFIYKNNIVTLSMSIPIGYLLNNFIKYLITDLIYPLLDKYLNLTKLKKDNNKFYYLLYEIIHVLITLYMIFMISRLLQDFIK